MPLRRTPPVDTTAEGFVSFAPPKLPARAGPDLVTPRVAVGPGHLPAEATAGGGGLGHVSGYPVQPAKVQRPPLRDETLARDRLLDWLRVKVNHRLVYVIAEAGYGKTTLLADWSRRTRLRTLWYRLDDEDKSWVAFINYLVAAGREHDPDFAPQTFSLLRELDTGGPTRGAIVDSFLHELQALGDPGAVLILDDFHVVDAAPDIREIVRAMLERAPERVSFVIASRRVPALRVARLRALGEVAELTTSDLRFNGVETERLFRETYGRPLDADVLDDLSRRTEGWVASLQLVQTAIRDRTSSEVRSFIRSLTGAEGDLYDYLAEEVVGDLPDDLQDFLMKTSVLDSIAPWSASLATSLSEEVCRRLMSEAERVRLVMRRVDAPGSGRSYHPLVRSFLTERLRRDRGDAYVAAVHRTIAERAWPPDWLLASKHFAVIGMWEDVRRVIDEATPRIMGAGEFAAAARYLSDHPADELSANLAIVSSRSELQAGRPEAAIALGSRAMILDPSSELARSNMTAIWLMSGDLEQALQLASTTATSATDPVLRAIAAATEDMLQLSLEGELAQFVLSVTAMAERQLAAGLAHYHGISLLNASGAMRPQGRAEETNVLATGAIEALLRSSSGHEVGSARTNRAWALAHLSQWDAALLEMATVHDQPVNASRAENLIELAEIHMWYGNPELARRYHSEAELLAAGRIDMRAVWLTTHMELLIREGKLGEARRAMLEAGPDRPTPVPAFKARRAALRAYLALREGSEEFDRLVGSAMHLAQRQSAWLWHRYCRVLAASASKADYSNRMREAIEDDHAFLSVLGELVVSRLSEADAGLSSTIEEESRRRPERWRPLLRREVDERTDGRWAAARILDVAGSREDVARLRALVKGPRTPAGEKRLGKRLARQLAERVYIEDQGRVSIVVGERVTPSSGVRRKVLALLCFLLSRPGAAASRDQVLDALWPDLEPTIALNSLNQTIYFLRRVFEPQFEDDLSPEYVSHDSNVIWLDQELIRSRSGDSWDLVRRFGEGEDVVDQLSATYDGKFALDFEYEEWALPYRESLHAAYLHVIESSVTQDLEEGTYNRGIARARRALEVDPTAEQLHVTLLRLYRQAGAFAAAAEQYAYYAHVVRTDLGVEPEPFEAL